MRLGQLADLFAIATKDQVSTERNYTDDHLAEKLRRQLTEVMPGNSLLFPAALEILENEQYDVASLTDRSLQEVLFGTESSIEQLQIVKEASKRLATMSATEGERAVATTIYHAAIACCLVYHNKKISQHSYDKLDESFALLTEKMWMVDELLELFFQARRVCQSKQSKK